MLEREHQQILENTEVRATDHTIARRQEREPDAIEATRSSSAKVPLTDWLAICFGSAMLWRRRAFAFKEVH